MSSNFNKYINLPCNNVVPRVISIREPNIRRDGYLRDKGPNLRQP